MVTENVVTDTILTVIATDRDKAETPNAEITFSWCAEDPDNFVMQTIADNTIGIGNSVGLVSGSLTDTDTAPAACAGGTSSIQAACEGQLHSCIA